MCSAFFGVFLHFYFMALKQTVIAPYDAMFRCKWFAVKTTNALIGVCVGRSGCCCSVVVVEKHITTKPLLVFSYTKWSVLKLVF